MTTLTISRDKAFAGILRSIGIIVDGQRVARVRRGGQVEVTIPPGQHALVAQVGWLKSGVAEFVADDHDRLRAECGYRGYGASLQIWLRIAGHDRLVW